MRTMRILSLLMIAGPAGHSAPASADEMIDQFYPLANYVSFPASVRPLMQEADFAYSRCRNGPLGRDPNGPEAMIACNRDYELRVMLEDKGWCWGGATTEAQKHWLACRRDPHYVRGALKAEGKPYSSQEIEQPEHR